MDSGDVGAVLLLGALFCAGMLVGGLLSSHDTASARREGATTCTRQQPGYVRQSVSACIQEVQQKAQRCQELSMELR